MPELRRFRGGSFVHVSTKRPAPFLEQLTPSERVSLNGGGVIRKFSRGSILFREGGLPENVILIFSGRVKISSLTSEGREVVLAVSGPGDILGEVSALDGEARSATATALDQLEALIIGTEDFQEFLETNPRVALAITKRLAQRLRDADRDRIQFSAFDTVGRVAGRLIELAERFGDSSDGSLRISLPLSQLELAGWAGASREAVSKALQVLRARGLISTHRGSTEILDLEGLKRRAS